MSKTVVIYKKKNMKLIVRSNLKKFYIGCVLPILKRSWLENIKKCIRRERVQCTKEKMQLVVTNEKGTATENAWN